MTTIPPSPDRGLRLVALIEAAKGGLVIVAGFGLLRAVGPGAEQAAAELVRHLHLNPARHLPQVFLAAAAHVSDRQLLAYAALAFAYAALRWAEAVGLWRNRAWAQWLGAASGAIYLPFEVAELLRGLTPLRALSLAANLFVVAYLLWRLRRR